MARRKVEEEAGAPDPNQELDVLELDQNLDDYPEPELLPPGYYQAEIQGVEIKNNQAGTGQYFAIRFVIPPERFPSSYDPENYADGKVMYYNLIRVPRGGDRRAIANLRKFLQQIGLSTKTNRIDPNEWIGRAAKLKVEHREYQGQTNENISAGGIQRVD